MTDTAAALTMIFSTPLALPVIVQGALSTGSGSASHHAMLEYASGSLVLTALLVVALTAVSAASFVFAGMTARREDALRKRTLCGPWWAR